MRKIMLVIDDYRELVAQENLLRRLGFDVFSVGKDILVNDAILRFHPEVVISTFKGRSVDGLRVSARVKKHNPPPRVVLAYGGSHAPLIGPDVAASIDGLIAMPIEPMALLRLLSQLMGIERDALVGKYEKIFLSRSVASEPQRITADGSSSLAPASISVKGGGGVQPYSRAVTGEWDPLKTPGSASTLRSDRSSRYDAYLRNVEGEKPTAEFLPREKMQGYLRELRLASELPKEVQEKLDAEKRAFVSALFKRK